MSRATPRQGAPLSGIPEIDEHLARVLPRLHEAGWYPEEMEPIAYGLKLTFPWHQRPLTVTLYYSKKKGLSVVPGQGRDAQVAGDIAALMRTSTATEASDEEQALGRWIGTDEAGKGDYFGPLVASAVLLDRDGAEWVTGLGVTDSKRLSNDKVRSFAGRLRGRLGDRCAVVAVGPRRYNEMYEQFRGGRGLNGLLAWCHGRAVRDVLEHHEPPDAVVVDRFASEGLIKRALPSGLRLIARPRAEDNPAVAAASVLARARYLRALEQLSEQLGVTLSSGAGDPVLRAGRELLKRHGSDVLAQAGKRHVRTTETIRRGR
jgi:ribonuclease HIII